MVVIFLPTTADTGITQERTASPSTCTVQAPHCAMPQPYLVPSMPASSRNAQRSGMSGSTLRSRVLPLTCSLIMKVSWWPCGSGCGERGRGKGCSLVGGFCAWFHRARNKCSA